MIVEITLIRRLILNARLEKRNSAKSVRIVRTRLLLLSRAVVSALLSSSMKTFDDLMRLSRYKPIACTLVVYLVAYINKKVCGYYFSARNMIVDV